MTREPDRFDKLREHPIFRYVPPGAREPVADLLSAALRQAADEALERAAQHAEDCIANGVTVLSAGEVGDAIRALASPAAAPAAVTGPVLDVFGRATPLPPPSEPAAPTDPHSVHCRSRRGGTCDCSEPPLPPAPSLLPRVLAALESRPDGYVLHCLVLELRRYITDRQDGCHHGDKGHPCALPRVQELEALLDEVDWALSHLGTRPGSPTDMIKRKIARRKETK